MIHIRDYEYKDKDQHRNLVIESSVFQKSNFEEEELNLDAVKTGASENFDRNLEIPGCHFFVAVDQEEVVGFVMVEASATYVGRGYVGDLYITHEFRGQGVGKQLMEKALEWLRDQNVSVASVAVHKNNDQAIKLYSDFGFADEPEVYRYLEKKL